MLYRFVSAPKTRLKVNPNKLYNHIMMKILVTGSAGHLGEAILRTLQTQQSPPSDRIEAIGLDILPSPFTTVVGSLVDRELVKTSLRGIDAIIHTATLHKPHVATHSRQEFVDVNITGTLNLLEEAAAQGVRSFVYTSTTSIFGDALVPVAGEPAVWITEDVKPIPKNIYGVTKTAAENLCELFHRNQKLNCVVLRTSRFFPEIDDNPAMAERYADSNIKLNEYLYRRVDIEDVVSAHLLAIEKAPSIGFDRLIISATTPFQQHDLTELSTNAPLVLARYFPQYADIYAKHQWQMFPTIDRVYVNRRALQTLGWKPQHDFSSLLSNVTMDGDLRSPLARLTGKKGYHPAA